jgi:hypothetical protein
VRVNADVRWGSTDDVRDWLEAWRGRDLTDAEAAAAAGQLLEDREKTLPVLLESFLDPEEDATLLAIASVTLKSWAEPYPTVPLLELLRGPGVGALGKALILNILERYGAEVDRPEVFGVGINLEEFPLQRGGEEDGGIQRG